MKESKRPRNRSAAALHLMILPALALLLVYSYGPMLGLVMAFQDFTPAQGWFGSPWVGMDNFKYVFSLPNFKQVVWNTLFISIMEIALGQILALVVTLLLNEVKNGFKRTVQTIIYIPHFLSWIILGGILLEVLSLSGIVNMFLHRLGIEPISFLGDSSIFPWTLIFSHLWKEVGFATIIFLAALSSINPQLYEAAEIDGAGRLRKMWNVTLPGMAPIIILAAVLSIGNLLNAGFDQVFTLYNPVVYDTGDIIDTFVYRLGLVQSHYSLATAVGIFKSTISFTFVALSYYLAYRLADYRIF
ncbi:ABC transporter permease [Cohnella fermenti]|uniref:Sugar ABC transporter permease n=1 Tax=Cohnella fermenti TaxID=2565925 RepID=A0A4S4BS34_9BACL|nr:ABC transporter permease subunit [Cohnella fermenti]THF77792.1 sugar ABC transporter permease [Cohnella fermenti]